MIPQKIGTERLVRVLVRLRVRYMVTVRGYSQYGTAGTGTVSGYGRRGTWVPYRQHPYHVLK